MAKTNPDLSLVKLAELEKEIESKAKVVSQWRLIPLTQVPLDVVSEAGRG